jgi:hypothetical protein
MLQWGKRSSPARFIVQSSAREKILCIPFCVPIFNAFGRSRVAHFCQRSSSPAQDPTRSLLQVLNWINVPYHGANLLGMLIVLMDYQSAEMIHGDQVQRPSDDTIEMQRNIHAVNSNTADESLVRLDLVAQLSSGPIDSQSTTHVPNDWNGQQTTNTSVTSTVSQSLPQKGLHQPNSIPCVMCENLRQRCPNTGEHMRRAFQDWYHLSYLQGWRSCASK